MLSLLTISEGRKCGRDPREMTGDGGEQLPARSGA